MLSTPSRRDPWPDLVQRLGLKPVPGKTISRKRMPSAKAANGHALPDWLQPKGDGHRTAALTALAGQLLAEGASLPTVQSFALHWNRNNTPPLPEAKVLQTCDSIERSDRVNHPDRAKHRDDLALANVPLFDLNVARADRFLQSTPPQRQWLLDKFLPAGIVGAIVAPGGTGKSQFLMQLAFTVATGHGLAGAWQCSSPGGVLMLCAEDDDAELHRRFHRLIQQLGGSAASAVSPRLAGGLFIRSTIGENTLMTARAGSGRAEVTRTTWPQRLAHVAQGIADLKLIVLDPASRFRGGEENSNEDATRFVEALEYLAKTTGAAVLIAHHASKGSMNSNDGASQADARGASALTDGVRWQLSMTKIGEKHPSRKLLPDPAEDRYLAVTLVKSNYTAPQPTVILRREGDGYLQAVDSPGAAVPADDGRTAVLAYIHSLKAPVTARELEARHCGQGKPVTLSQHRARDLLKALVSEGLLTGTGRAHLRLTNKGAAALAAAVATPGNAAGGQSAAQHPAAKKANKNNDLSAAPVRHAPRKKP